MEYKKYLIERVCCAVDCGIVVNTDAAFNLAKDAIVDGIGIAVYDELIFKNGVPEKNNFHQYRMMQMSETPKKIDVHIVENGIDTTGLGEPTFPPVFWGFGKCLIPSNRKADVSSTIFKKAKNCRVINKIHLK
jgi:isoquinoline 1-oxidoreductase beta subunit